MNMYDIIEKKKLNLPLDDDEIKYVIDGYTKGDIPDYQVSALLMAIYFNKMNFDETLCLTDCMLHSGDVTDLSGIKKVKLDKHSTGGVGDKVSLILGPVVASCGACFAKMSGRGLGHTGGTLDKLESIPGFRVEISPDEFEKISNEVGLSICGQTGNITPADKKLYALRDATATVDNVSLISSSIMSKKIAVDSDCLLLDVKVGSGAFMKNVAKAEELARLMVKIGNAFKRPTKALVTNMDKPLGKAIGNSLEVIEAVNTLKGNGPEDIYTLVITIAGKLLHMAHLVKSEEDGIKMAEESIKNGKAFEKLKEFVKAQSGDVSYIEDTSKFELSTPYPLYAEKSGYIEKMDALSFGEVARNLGAGRERMDSVLDMGAGILLEKTVGEWVNKGEKILTIYTKKDTYKSELEFLSKNILISDHPVKVSLIYEEID
ncbi:pyrimidine-nucleoside phosphorylase [Clostridiales bacterium KA00134]|nr:pyrimidine-nucleoside phosphorylase [Clostridiales bacterium KA00134]